MSNDRRLRLEVILAAIDKATGPMKAITGNSKGMARAVKEARDRLRDLEAQGKRIDTFRSVARDVAVTGNTLQQAQAKVRDLAREMAATDAPTKVMVRNFEAAKREAAQLKSRHAALSQQQQRLRTELQAAGVPLQGMANHQRALRTRIGEATEALRRQNEALRVQGERMKKIAAARAQYDSALEARDKFAGAGASMTVAGAAMGAPLINAVREYATFEDAMLGLQRQIDGVGEVGSNSYRQIAAEVRLLGRELPVPINQIADMYTAAARMDVPREELQRFTRTITMMATAFDAVPDEIAESMGKVAKNFRIPVTEIGALADVINYLDDNAISKAGDIIEVLNRTSGVAASVAMSERATAALASTLLTMGERSEPAATAINAIVQKFAAAEKGAKPFLSALDEIGISAAKVQAGMQTDAQGTLFEVIEAIQRLPAASRTGVMVELVGMEHADTLAKLVTNTSEWRRQIELANSTAAAGSMEREFQKRTQALTAHWERFKNAIFDVNTESGAALRGALIGVMTSFGGMLNRAADWMRANPELTAALVKTAAVLALVVTAMGALALGMAAVLGPFAVLRYGLVLFKALGGGLLGTLLGLAKGALPALGVALKWVIGLIIANPIGAAIAGIALAALLIYRYWEPIKAFFGTLWEGIKANFNATVDFFAAFPARFVEIGTQMMQGMVDGISNGLGNVKAAITGAGESAIGWFKEKLGIHSPSRVFAQLGGFTMAGLAQGLTRGQSGPLAALSRTARNLVAAAGTGLAGVALASPGIAFDNRPPLAASAPNGAAAGGNHYEIHIHAAPGMDNQALARAVVAELDRRDREAAARRRSRLADTE